MNKRKERVPNNLREYRLKAGLTQKEVAALIGVNNEERVCHWEKGNNVPSIFNLLRLAALYKTSLTKLFPMDKKQHL